ncbi:MAG TPA: thioesterase [Actinobacteria bacterium]|jgi:predicted thioesterase|nr:thioesterase [Actinomycetota bacterium]HCP61014.1 thioesterase [Actinomycetota bacterium]
METTGWMEVTHDRAAAAVGSGSVNVLATPEIVALVERTAVQLLDGHLPDGQTTVGTRIELDHLAPTPVGLAVSARVRLEAVEGRTLRFTFEVRDPAGEVAVGSHVRTLVDRVRFERGAARRRAQPR